jgi:hypothetical protein
MVNFNGLYDPAKITLGWMGLRELFNPERGEVRGGRSRSHPPPRHGILDTFLRGPIPWPWWSRAASLPGRALHVASAVRYLVGWADGPVVSFALGDLDRFLGVGYHAARRGLQVLVSAGLVEMESRVGGQLRARACEIEEGPDRRQLRGPIPWAWWLRACGGPGKSLHVASICWFLAGLGRSAVFELRPEDSWGMGLSRQSIYRGLTALELAGLVSVVRRSGRTPVVTILDLPAAKPGGGIDDRRI